jgi:peptidoglycan/xylan/chitin deacetylase (PgdA/CDA1 family)
MVYLMYHELARSGCLPRESEAGYRRYVVDDAAFRQQLEWLKANDFDCLSVGEALDGPERAGAQVVMTFDDGNETDLLTAAPLLEELGFRATFYLIAGSIGAPGHLSAAQARELDSLGFEIGCHSMTHRFLTELDPASLQVEITAAKERLEQLLGSPVRHFSCPGGRWNSGLRTLAQAAGYYSVATSRVGVNLWPPDRYRLNRVAVLHGTDPTRFGRLCRGALLARRTSQAFFDLGKSILGGAAYARLRSLLLREP